MGKPLHAELVAVPPCEGRVLDLLRKVGPRAVRRLSDLVNDPDARVSAIACREVVKLLCHPLVAPHVLAPTAADLAKLAPPATSADPADAAGQLAQLERARARIDEAIHAARAAAEVQPSQPAHPTSQVAHPLALRVVR